MIRTGNQLQFETIKEWETQGRVLAGEALTGKGDHIFLPPKGLHFVYTPLAAGDRVANHNELWDCGIPRELGLTAVGEALGLGKGCASIVCHRDKGSPRRQSVLLAKPLDSFPRVTVAPGKGIGADNRVTRENLERLLGRKIRSPRQIPLAKPLE